MSEVKFFNKKIKPKPSVVFDVYWRFAAERQNIFFERLKSPLPPWTSDPILRLFKFTNAYRASDRVSQYLIKEIIYKGEREPKEILFRILLFKIFNKIETWEKIKKEIGEITYRAYKFEIYNSILDKIKNQGNSIYSGAYIMASGVEAFGHKLKHANHLKLIETILEDNLYSRISSFKTMEELYNKLKEYPTIGPFLAYQLAIDINYSTLCDFSEMEFVKAGPGAKDGIKKCFYDLGEYSEEDTIKMMADNQFQEFNRLEIDFKDLWGRPLQLIDCQNLFCEVDKYSRVAYPEIAGISERKRIKQKFRLTSIDPIKYFFPPKWNLNIK